MFIMQAPRMSPTARSGTLAKAVAEIALASSGREVMVASRTRPIQARQSPVFSAIISPPRHQSTVIWYRR